MRCTSGRPISRSGDPRVRVHAGHHTVTTTGVDHGEESVVENRFLVIHARRKAQRGEALCAGFPHDHRRIRDLCRPDCAEKRWKDRPSGHRRELMEFNLYEVVVRRPGFAVRGTGLRLHGFCRYTRSAKSCQDRSHDSCRHRGTVAAHLGRRRRRGRPGEDGGDYGETFAVFAKLSGLVPMVRIVAGRCYAGNASLLGCCDVVIAKAGWRRGRNPINARCVVSFRRIACGPTTCDASSIRSPTSVRWSNFAKGSVTAS